MSHNVSMRHKLEQHYDQYRRDAINNANQLLAGRYSGVRVSLVDSKAYSAFKAVEHHANRIVDWDWVSEFQSWKMKYPKRFEAATWKSGKLIGFSLGRPTYHGTGLRLDYIEKMPETSESLLDITYVALLTYAGLLGATHIKIMNPKTSGVRDYYVSKGFAYDTKQNACTRSIMNI